MIRRKVALYLKDNEQSIKTIYENGTDSIRKEVAQLYNISH